MLDESEEEAGKLAVTTSDDGGEPFVNESDGQLLLEIIRNEEDRDLRHLVSCWHLPSSATIDRIR